MIVTIIGCPTCSARNRVGPIAQGVPRCPRCKSALPWVVDGDTDTFTAETTASVPVVVDFWAAWCGPCRMISPVLEDLAKRYAGHLKVVKVDLDANPGLAARFSAQSVPLLVVIRDRKEVDRVVGALPRAALEQRLGQCSPREFTLRARAETCLGVARPEAGFIVKGERRSWRRELVRTSTEVRDAIASVTKHPRRLAGDHRMLMGDGCASAPSRPASRTRTIAVSP